VGAVQLGSRRCWTGGGIRQPPPIGTSRNQTGAHCLKPPYQKALRARKGGPGRFLPVKMKTSSRCRKLYASRRSALPASPETAPREPLTPHRSRPSDRRAAVWDPPGRVRAAESGSGAPVFRRGRREAPPRSMSRAANSPGKPSVGRQAATQRSCRRSAPPEEVQVVAPLTVE
jgi:hypothetical protein